MKIFSVYRGSVNIVRGTPIRIKSIQEFLKNSNDIDLYTATYDKTNTSNENHVPLKKNIWIEIPSLVHYTNKNNIDMVICHGMLSYPVIIAIRLFTKAKVILEKHGFYEIEQKEFGHFSNYQWIKSKIVFWIAYKFCHLITTCSDTATEIIKKYNKNTVTIWGGVDLKYFNPDIKPENYIQQKKEIVIGYAGNSRPYQGLSFLLDTFEKLNFNEKGYTLAILSSDRIEESKVVDGVQLIKRVPHEKVANFLAECDILVVPRINSVINDVSFPSKLIEFMAMGKPVIGSRTSDIHRVITHGLDGLLFDPENSEELIECIVSLKNKKRRDSLGQEAYNTVCRVYTWDKQGDCLVKNLQKLSIKK